MGFIGYVCRRTPGDDLIPYAGDKGLVTSFEVWSGSVKDTLRVLCWYSLCYQKTQVRYFDRLAFAFVGFGA